VLRATGRIAQTIELRARIGSPVYPPSHTSATLPETAARLPSLNEDRAQQPVR